MSKHKQAETQIKEINIPPEANHLVVACSDLHSISKETNTRYLVVGSVASVCAVGELYRVPGDVDSWYDINHAREFRKALRLRGYDHTFIDAPESPYPNPLERFKKNNSVIDVRGASYTERGIEYPIRLPIPGISVDKRPIGNLICTKASIEPNKSKFGSTTIMTTKKEALWIALQATLPLIQMVGDKINKRALDLERLSEGLDMETVKTMLDEKPGLYLGSKPIVTTDNQGLHKLLMLGMKLKKRVMS